MTNKLAEGDHEIEPKWPIVNNEWSCSQEQAGQLSKRQRLLS